SVVNLLGQEVISQNVVGNRTDINVSELPNGIYLVKILDGQNWIVRKIVIE
ncbi:MAG: T9SS type A sorting domain-containing protein, partial [Bacteroidales bacterium]|nr:T9SS type A sorting domain-containing protein [Bacteroidales bacterium]